jgi:ATP-dependent Lon protease
MSEIKKGRAIDSFERDMITEKTMYQNIPPSIRHAIAESYKNRTWVDGITDDVDFDDQYTDDNPIADEDNDQAIMRLLSKTKEIPTEPNFKQLDPMVPKPSASDMIRLVDYQKFQARIERESPSSNGKGNAQILALASIVAEKKLMPVNDFIWEELDRLRDEMPNFRSAIDDLILPCLHARYLGGDHAQLPQIIFDGPPGVGKTRFAKRLATALGLPVQIYQTSNGDPMKLTGLRSSWNGARPGDIAAAMAESNIANHLIFFDEIDKIPVANYNRGGSIFDVLLTLTETESSKDFRDEYLDGVPINMSFHSTIATSNDAGVIPEALLSRFRIVKIDMPSGDGLKKMIDSILHDVLSTAKWGRFFAEDLSDDVMSVLMAMGNAREIRNAIEVASWKALSRVSVTDKKFGLKIATDDLFYGQKKPAFKMGFSA